MRNYLFLLMLFIVGASVAPIWSFADMLPAQQGAQPQPSPPAAAAPAQDGPRFFPLDRKKLIINHKKPVAAPSVASTRAIAPLRIPNASRPDVP